MSLKEAIPCNEKSTEPRRAQRGDYWVLYNYVPMSMTVRCWESVTYTTHADYTFLDNLEPLLERWRAPISIAMHAPGTDFPATLDAIKYSRNCGSPLISQLVTFHVFFSSKHVPKAVNKVAYVIAASSLDLVVSPLAFSSLLLISICTQDRECVTNSRMFRVIVSTWCMHIHSRKSFPESPLNACAFVQSFPSAENVPILSESVISCKQTILILQWYIDFTVSSKTLLCYIILNTSKII